MLKTECLTEIILCLGTITVTFTFTVQSNLMGQPIFICLGRLVIHNIRVDIPTQEHELILILTRNSHPHKVKVDAYNNVHAPQRSQRCLDSQRRPWWRRLVGSGLARLASIAAVTAASEATPVAFGICPSGEKYRIVIFPNRC